MMMVMPMDTRRLSQILDIGKLAAGGGVGEIRRQLVELVRGCGIALRLGRLRGALQIRRDLLGDLFILGRIGLLELLKRTH